VAAVAAGEFGSYFAGKDKPAAPAAEGEDAADPAEKAAQDAAEQALGKRRDKGTGRLLVIGSNMGLEDLSTDTIFEGFSVAKLGDNALQNIDEFRGYGARYQNWQVRLRQIQHLIFENLQFVFNALDWSVQQDALVELRSKQYVRRPLEQTDEGARAAIRFYGIAGGPLIVVLLGFFYWLYQRARRQRIALVAGSKAPIGVRAKAGAEMTKSA
jgi:hypothetical protein